MADVLVPGVPYPGALPVLQQAWRGAVVRLWVGLVVLPGLVTVMWLVLTALIDPANSVLRWVTLAITVLTSAPIPVVAAIWLVAGGVAEFASWPKAALNSCLIQVFIGSYPPIFYNTEEGSATTVVAGVGLVACVISAVATVLVVRAGRKPLYRLPELGDTTVDLMLGTGTWRIGPMPNPYQRHPGSPIPGPGEEWPVEVTMCVDHFDLRNPTAYVRGRVNPFLPAHVLTRTQVPFHDIVVLTPIVGAAQHGSAETVLIRDRFGRDLVLTPRKFERVRELIDRRLRRAAYPR